MPSEFDLIQQYFSRPAKHTVLGVGDDAALIRVAPSHELAVSTDMLVAGRHFFPKADPYKLGHKTLAVNLSDLAAMGATPRWATLSIALPRVNERWLQKFSQGLFDLAERHGVALIGGDTTRGPLAFSITILGEVPRGRALRRSGAKSGDEIWVSGTVGDAALVLAHLQGRTQLAERDARQLAQRLHQPQPRVRLGQALLGVAHSAIDISDGLLADLEHVLEASRVGAELHWPALPASVELHRYLDRAVARQAMLAGGDDYELCFTAAPGQHARIVRLSRRLQLPLTCIGRITSKRGLVLRDARGKKMSIEETGFDHFA